MKVLLIVIGTKFFLLSLGLLLFQYGFQILRVRLVSA